MKQCARCKETLPLESFGSSSKNRDGKQYSCKACNRAYVKRHYEKNKQAYAAKARKWEAARKDILDAAKARPCADCGGVFPPCVMDFDHLPGSAKAFSLNMGRKIGASRVDAEIAKCEVVCANCHRIRTNARR